MRRILTLCLVALGAASLVTSVSEAEGMLDLFASGMTECLTNRG